MRVLSIVTALVAAFTSAVSADVLGQGFKLYGINYDMQGCNDYKMSEDLKAIAKISNSVRIYGLATGGACPTSRFIQLAKENNLNVALGMWLQSENDIEGQLNLLRALMPSIRGLANEGKLMGFHVGSEAIYRNNYSADKAVEYLNKVRRVFNDNNVKVQLTIADVVDSYYRNPQLLAAVDYVSINQFSFWEQVDVNVGMGKMLDRIRSIRVAAAKVNKEVIISETGWASGGANSAEHTGVPSLASQKTFFENFYQQANAHNMKYYWFVAFDKAPEGAVTVEKYFGTMDTNRVLKESYKNVNLAPRAKNTFASMRGLLAETFNPAAPDDIKGVEITQASTDPLVTVRYQWFFDAAKQQYRSLNSDRCLDAYQPQDGGIVHTWACIDTEKNQKWVYDATTQQLKHASHTGFCLEDRVNTGTVELWKCSATNVNQRWGLNGAPVDAPGTIAPPKTTAPPTTAPVTTAPPTTAPVTTAPPTTAPVTTAPPTTAPVTTAPPKTAPVTTAPPTTAPVTTAPPTTAPVTTAPPTTAPVTTAPVPVGPESTAVRFFTKESKSTLFVQLVRTDQAVALVTGAAGVAGSEWIYNPTTQLVQSKDSNLCLDAYEGWNGGRVHVWQCNAAEKNQKWEYASNGQLQHKTHKGYCLDADQSGNNGAGLLQLWGCHLNNNNQVWRKVSASAKAVRIANADSTVVEFISQSQQLGKTAVNQGYSGDAQSWFWNPYKKSLTSKVSGECLDAYQPQENGIVHTWACIDTEKNQYWAISNGLIQHATHQGFCLAYANAANKQLVLKKCSATDATQQFSLAEFK